jgi:hypothetical protein
MIARQDGIKKNALQSKAQTKARIANSPSVSG